MRCQICNPTILKISDCTTPWIKIIVRFRSRLVNKKAKLQYYVVCNLVNLDIVSFDKERQLVDKKVVYAAEGFHELESAVMLLLWLVAEEREGGEDLKIEPKAGKISNNEKKAMSASSYQLLTVELPILNLQICSPLGLANKKIILQHEI